MNVDYALLTDLYQITMAQGYWDAEKAGEEACFTMYFRDYPFKGGYAVACGMAQLADLVETFRFSEEDIAYLASLDAPAGGPLFDPAFLEYLRDLRLSVDIDAVPEGAARAGHRPHHAVPAYRDGAVEHGELPDAHRHQGRPCVPRRQGAPRGGVRPAPGPGPRRRVGIARGGGGRLRLHLERAGRQALRHPGLGHPRPFLGHVLRRRAHRLPRVRPHLPEQLHPSGGYLRCGAGHQKRHHRG